MGVMDSLRLLLSALRQADLDYSLIEEGDRIALGISGGKDSLILLYLLSLYPKFSKKHFEIVPIFLDLGFEWNRDKLGPLKEYCQGLGHPLEVVDSTYVYDILKANAKEGKHLPCSICSRMKKAGINRAATEKGCNKVAFAHHSDDALETLFMNMLHGGRIATFEPVMRLERAGITFIRPLIYAKEKDVIAFSASYGLPVTDTCCPANKKTDREEMKKMLRYLEERYPESEENLRLSLRNYAPSVLFWKDLAYEVKGLPHLSIRPILTPEEMRQTKASKRKAKEGEENYRILFKGKPVGEFSLLEPKGGHRLEIFGSYGAAKYLTPSLLEIIRIKVKKNNPLRVFYHGKKEIALSLNLLETETKGLYKKTFSPFK